MKNVAERSLEMTSLFEAELLVRLILRQWHHPLALDDDFAGGLLEAAADALRSACEGDQFIAELPAPHMNLVAAMWYAEQCTVDIGGHDVEARDGRRAWLQTIRKALPSCFCNPGDLNTA